MKTTSERFEALQDVINAEVDSVGRTEMLEAVLDSFDNTIAVSDPKQEDNPIIYVNHGFEEVTGYTFEEVVGRNCRFLQGNDRDQPGIQMIREGMKNREYTRALLRNYRKNGEMFWNELHITPVFDKDGELALFTGVQNDVTKRENLASERAFLDAAIASADTSILITDTQLDAPGPHILYANSAYERLTGYSVDEVIGRNPRFMQGPDSDRTVLNRLKGSLEAGKSFEGETVNYRKDGSEFIMAWYIAPVRLAGDNIDFWVATQRDVTKRRKLERRVLEAASEEQRRVARDLHDGVVQDLSAAQMMVATLVNRAEQGEDIAEDLAELGNYLEETTSTTRQLSHRMNAGNLAGGGLMLALERLTRTLNSDATRVTFAYETPLVIEKAERAEQVYRIAQEGLNNAVKHAQASEITLRLNNDNEDFTLSVRDNGVGIPETAGSDGMGLDNMHYRAQVLNAELDIGRLESGGTLLTCRFTNT